jgi:hypothetical protein
MECRQRNRKASEGSVRIIATKESVETNQIEVHIDIDRKES